MPDAPETKPDDIAPLLRIGLEDVESAALTLDATMRVSAPTPRSGGSAGARGWNPPSVEELQKALPQYEISAFIARGGMGAVYKGMQKTLKRPVAIKVLPPEIDDGDLQFAARFKHEAQAMAQLSHPNIVAVFDAGETPDGLLYFVMEFIEGTDVAQLIASEGQLDPLRAIQITTSVCEALAFAHEEGIIHRDIKPSNIMLDKRGRVKVADFGLAKTVNLEHSLQTQSNMALGTPDFIAPEALIPGMKVDQRADIYAVGVMLYQMLTGHIPRGRFELPSGVVPRVDKGFDPIVDKAMQTDREKRYSSATEMKRDVESVVMMKDGSVGTPVRSTQSGGEVAKNREAGRSARAPLLLAAAAVVVLGLGAFFITREPTGQAKVVPSSSSTAKDAAGWSLVDLEAVRLAERGLTTAPGGWYRMTGMQTYSPFAGRMTNAGLRVEVGGRLLSGRMPEILLREQETRNYNAFLDGDGQSLVIQRYDGTVPQGHPDHYRTLGSQRLKKPVPSGSPYTLEFVAVGRRLRARINDTTLEVEAPDPPAAGLVTLYNPDFDTFRQIERIELDGLSEAEALKAAEVKENATTSSAPHSAAPSVTAMKLWDTPATLPHQPGVQWEDGAVTLRGTSLRHPVKYRDLVFRASMRVESEPGNSQLHVRSQFDRGQSDPLRSSWYSVGMTSDGKGLILKRWLSGKSEVIQSWKLPQAPKPGEWLLVEIKAVGELLTVRADGKMLGTATDPALLQPGGVVVTSTQEGRFRDIEVINLDGLSEAEALKAAGIEAGSSSPSLPVSQSPSPTWRKVLTRFEDVPADVRTKGLLRWQDGWLEPISATQAPPLVILPGPKVRNGGIRVRGRWSPDIKIPTLGNVSLRRTRGADTTNQVYRANVIGPTPSNVSLSLANDNTKAQEELVRHLLQRPLKPGDEYELELIAIGDQLHVRVNDERLPVVTDTRLKEGTMGLHCIHPMRDVEVIHLDGLSEAEALKTAGIADAVRPETVQQGWKRVEFPSQAVTDEIKGKGGTAMDGALLGVWRDAIFAANSDQPVRNAAVRITAPAAQAAWPVKLVTRVAAGGAWKQYTLHVWPKKAEIARYESGDQVLKVFLLPKTLTEGGDFTAQFASIGSDHHVWVNGQFLGSVTDGSHSAPGKLGIQANDGRFKSVEMLLLDGLGEAEALKAAGIALSAPAPAEVPYATLGGDGMIHFPAGGWSWMRTREDQALQREVHAIEKEDAWMRWDERTYGPPAKPPPVGVQNLGVRVWFRGRRVTEWDFPQINLRSIEGQAGPNFHIKYGKLQIRSRASGFPILAEAALSEPLSPGKEYLAEFYAIGSRLIARVNGQTVTAESDVPPAPGYFSIHGADMDWFKDPHVLNLDGLSEAEALKAAGIRE
jgi:serine/threonine protein kinase